MNRFVKAIIAGIAAKKYGSRVMGGGCLGTVIVFFLVYWLLGNMHC